jgi:hypothetical protein
LLALLGAHHILHVSRIRVNTNFLFFMAVYVVLFIVRSISADFIIIIIVIIIIITHTLFFL